MIQYAMILLIVALFAGVLGFGFAAGATATIAKCVFVAFLALFLLSLFWDDVFNRRD